eukprot:TRINITY_DN45257_c0_g1_i1.p1 TRINITY_DN45257_c0_g1~~TRINITY_DN45257_c0_g1_i1.p1  ORF type:complete len:424 (+),score=73.10 TRINITY_DN45257_c0_g1_i1:90-1361(+)
MAAVEADGEADQATPADEPTKSIGPVDMDVLWENCALSSEEREAWAALDNRVAAATPPPGQRPCPEQLAEMQEANLACESFLRSLAPYKQDGLRQIADLCKVERRKARQLAEKKDKRARKIAAKKNSQNLAQTHHGDGGGRMESHPPTVLDHSICPSSENPLVTPQIEASHVHNVYDSIADHWNHTRYKAWPKVEEFLRRLPFGALVADLGCGNGKNIPAIQEAGGFVVATDVCEPLVRIAAESHGSDAAVADCLCSNLRGGVFDAVISIAVLHHLSTEPRRIQALREGARLLRPGGEFLVYCWSLEQDDEQSKSHHRFPGQDVLVPWLFRTPGIKKQGDVRASVASDARGGDGTEGGDGGGGGGANKVLENGQHPAQTGVFQRYCHVYREGELVALMEQVSELEIVDHWYDSGNWCAVGRRR